MKKKGIIISLVILLVASVITIVINKSSQKYIMKDGMILALTLDGAPIITFPERGKYNINIDCGNTGNGIWLVEEWKLAVEDIIGNIKCKINFTTNPQTLKSEVTNKANTVSNGYRYSGKQPNNWVWFNGEKWRIIGSIPTKQNNGILGDLVKIIRNEPIGGFSYDASTTTISETKGAWGSNTLYNLLNTHYYSSNKSSMNGQSHSGCYSGYSTEYISKPNCDFSEIGILSNSYYGQMVEDAYWNIGASNYSVIPSAAYTSETSNQTVPGKVGLISASDYGYASDSKYHNIKMDSYTGGNIKAPETNWLYNGGNEWTLTQNSNSTNNALSVQRSGIMNYSGAKTGLNIRPVVYLDSSVYVVSGNGSESNPYQIAM